MGIDVINLIGSGSGIGKRIAYRGFEPCAIRRGTGDVDIFPLFAGPFLMFFAAPLIFPFSWTRLFLTWVVPILPALLFIDTMLSMLRSYTLDELKEIVASASLPEESNVEVFEFTEAAGMIRMPAIILGAAISGTNGRLNQKRKENTQ